MNLNVAKNKLKNIIKITRAHFYKPIQIAEILYQIRSGNQEVSALDLESYRSKSKKWRDEISEKLVGRSCSSSSKFQDNLFDDNACPPEAIELLSQFNIINDGIVEEYIYGQFELKLSQFGSALNYINDVPLSEFNIDDFMSEFSSEAGLKRSLDKILEILIYSLFETIITTLDVEIDIKIKTKNKYIDMFDGFIKKVLLIDSGTRDSKTQKVHFYRAGVTNAADRGIDMYCSFGAVVQIKHLSLTEPLALDIVNTVSSDNIIIVCKDVERNIIESLVGQLGWKSKIQSIITIEEVSTWYSLIVKGNISQDIKQSLIDRISNEIKLEFPSSDSKELNIIKNERDYQLKIRL